MSDGHKMLRCNEKLRDLLVDLKGNDFDKEASTILGAMRHAFYIPIVIGIGFYFGSNILEPPPYIEITRKIEQYESPLKMKIEIDGKEEPLFRTEFTDSTETYKTLSTEMRQPDQASNY